VAYVQLYIAQSLDGYVAEVDGGMTWIERFLGDGEDYGYSGFVARLEALVMGASTYQQELERGTWPHGGLPTWVTTHRALARPTGADIRFAQGAIGEIVASIEQEIHGNVWLVGGGSLARQFVDAQLLDELILFVAPVLLGAGIPLFGGTVPTEATLRDVKPYPSGLVELRYGFARAGAMPMS
jgi:dihydrofolate reductase